MKIKALIKYFLIANLFLFINGCKKSEDNLTPKVNTTNGKTTAVFNPGITYGNMTDQDGNEYRTVKIGNQTWMAENLRTTKYRDGSDIPLVTDNSSWDKLKTGAYCNYNNSTSDELIATYGRLYNWYAINNSSNLAPTGWHVATDKEWSTLINNLGDTTIAANMLKETGSKHWSGVNTNSINSIGFTALPGGYRYYGGGYIQIGEVGDWWSSTKFGKNDTVWSRSMNNIFSDVNRVYDLAKLGKSVRCVKD